MYAFMMVRRISMLGLGLLFLCSGLSAQGRQPPERGMTGPGMGMGEMMPMMGQGMMGGGMMEMMGQGMGMMATGGPGPAMILRMGDALDLDEEQRTRLEIIQQDYSDTAQPLVSRAMRAHRDAETALEGDSPDFDAYEEAIREGANQMVEVHVAMARAAAEAREVLSDDQLDRLESGMQMMSGTMGPGQSGMMSH